MKNEKSNYKEDRNWKQNLLLHFWLFLYKWTDVWSISIGGLSPNIPPWVDISIDPAIIISTMLKIIRYFLFCYWDYQGNFKFYVNELFRCRKILLLLSKIISVYRGNFENSFSVLKTKYGKLLFKDGIEYEKAICEIC